MGDEMRDLNVDFALANVQILRVNGTAPFLLPVELGSNIGPEAGGVLNGAFVHFEILQIRSS